MIPIVIRNLLPDDAEIISFMKKRLAGEWKISEKEIEDEYITPSFAGGFPYIFIALSEDREFAGKIFLSIEKQWFLGIDNQPWISAVFVPEKFRRQGIAQLLIKKAEDVCRSRGYKKMYLDTISAAGYYRKIGGWTELGTDVWKGDTVTIMSKEL